MGVGNPKILKHALNCAVLAIRSVQRVEGDIGLELGKYRGNIGTDINAGDLVTGALKRIGTGHARSQANRPLGGEPAHQNGNVFGLCQNLGGHPLPSFWCAPLMRGSQAGRMITPFKANFSPSGRHAAAQYRG